jgi:hypothetical protein
MTSTAVFSCYDVDFSVSAPFAEGHPLTAAEADALNGLRAENISHILRSKFKVMREPLIKAAEQALAAAKANPETSAETLTALTEAVKNVTVSPEQLAELRALVAETDSKYVFQLGRVGGNTPRVVKSPLEAEINRLATMHVKAAWTKKGNVILKKGAEATEPNHRTQDQFLAAIATVAANELTIKAAKENLAKQDKQRDAIPIPD